MVIGMVTGAMITVLFAGGQLHSDAARWTLSIIIVSSGCFIIAAPVFAAMIHASVSAVFLSPYSVAIGMFLVPMFLALLERCSNAGLKISIRAKIGRSYERPLASIVFALWLILSYAHLKSLSSYYSAMESDKRCLVLTGELRSLWPRFWLHGDFPRPPSMACDESKIPPEARP
jgi:hypothetical protein